MPEIKTMQFDAKIESFENINPLFSKVKIRIAYAGLNRNNSSISKETLEKAITTIFNCPIIGEYIEEKDEFGGHGGKIEISDKGVKFIRTTIPYGVINDNSEITWEDVVEDDGTVNTYLCATGYLWTGRYPELEQVIENSSGQSMEIEISSGSFNKDKVYEIDDFVFSALCILGNVEPCFESASISAYTLDKDEFKKHFSQMMKELKFSLQQTVEDENHIDIKGGQNMPENIKNQNQFSLTSEQLKRELKNLLSANKTVDDWGYEYSEFYLVDCVPDESLVIAQSWEDYCLYAFSFAVDGDKVSLDVESKKRYKVQYVPMELDGVTDPDAVIDNFAIVPELVEYKLQVKEKEMEQKFSAELEAKEKSLQEVTTEAETKFNALQEQFTSVESELNELKEFKSDSIKKEREDKENVLYEKLASQLSEEEITQFKEKSADMTIEELEKEMFALVGQKVANNTVHNFNKTTTHITMSIDEGNKEPINAPYGGVVDKYIQK